MSPFESKQAPREERDFEAVLPEDVRPAREGGTCFYCFVPVGGKHEPYCVIPKGAGSYLVALENSMTGEVRFYRQDFYWDDFAEFMWTEGNFACDCNRAMMFQRANGEEATWDHPCGDVLYTALYAQLPDGTKIPLEEEMH
jgi:hypothetical protein